METRDVDRLAQMFKWVLGGLLAAFASLPVLVQGLALMQLLDVAGGLMLAGRDGKISSRAFEEGWRRKAYAWLIVMAVYVVEVWVAYPLPPVLGGMTVADVTVTGFIFMEVLSLIENAQRGGLAVPNFLVTMFAEGRRRFGGGEGDKREGGE